jgi:hypothetical protein
MSQWPETTPRPWVVRVVDDAVRPRVFITREFGVEVPPKFYVAFLPEGPGSSESDARLIVAAVNALPEVEALCETTENFAGDAYLFSMAEVSVEQVMASQSAALSALKALRSKLSDGVRK